MPKTKVADLSAGLVAVKGSAAPREGAPREEIVPLNFRIPASLRREFKTYAAQHDMKLNELFRAAFDAYRVQQGD
jgi:hypothetical protein